ncbi:type IV pilin protein [Haliea atlantica]|jgi:type IV pilus assembly protein PilE
MIRARGFSLLELLLVLVLLGWLATLALPGFQEQILRARRVVATTALWELMLRQEQYFTRHRRYAMDLSSLGVGHGDHFYLDAHGRRQEEPGIYRISVVQGEAQTLRLLATAVGRQARDHRCARLWLDSTGAHGSVTREALADAAESVLATGKSACWP